MPLADSHSLVNIAKELCNDLSLNSPQTYSYLPTNILEHNSSETSEKTEDQLSQLERKTLHSKEIPSVKIKNVEEQAEPELCKVCGDKASKHSYYGGKSCPSCRQFFRRSVKAFSR